MEHLYFVLYMAADSFDLFEAIDTTKNHLRRRKKFLHVL